MGQSPASSTYNDEGKGLPFYQGKAEFGVRHPIVKKWCSAPLKIADQGDILLSVRAPVGPTNICNVKSCIGRGLAAIRCKKNKADHLFIWFYLRNIEKRIASKGVGSTFTAIGREEISKIQVPSVNYFVQRKIASILEKAESAREKRKEANRLINEFLKSAFLEMFGDPVRNLKKFEKLKLEKVCKKIQDGTHYSPKQQESGFPYVTAKNIKPWGINLTNVTYISEKEHKAIYKRCDPKKGDVIYIKDGVTAGLAKVNSLDFEFSMLSSIALIRPNKNLLNPFYLEYYLNHPHVYKRILERKSGSAITRLILKEIKDIEIHTPPIDRQNRFANLVQKVEKLKEKQSESENELNNLFNSLMQRAFRGKVS